MKKHVVIVIRNANCIPATHFHKNNRRSQRERYSNMGGGNGQKSAAAREKNLAKLGGFKTEEERKAAAAKAAKDAVHYKCSICLQTFMINATPTLLYQHVVAKHPSGTEPRSCFPILAGYDPNAPAAPVVAAVAPLKPKKKAPAAGLDDLLNAGLKPAKGKR